jgi:hypothetical protein
MDINIVLKIIIVSFSICLIILYNIKMQINIHINSPRTIKNYDSQFKNFSKNSTLRRGHFTFPLKFKSIYISTSYTITCLS